MGFFSKPKITALSRFLSRLPGFSRPDKHSLRFLNAAQFMGVVNDNIFKLVVVFLLIGVYGPESASTLLSITGAIYVIPFLLFSSAAGILADRFSKQRLLVGMKIAEIVIMSLAVIAFSMKSVWASFLLLFFLSTHSSMFGPSKYAIIPELVPNDKISRANGAVTSFTYMGMILGTFLASFLTEMTDKNFILVVCFCLMIAFIGFIATFGIKYTPPQGSSTKINPLFIKEIFATLKFCATRKHLLFAVFGAAYFLFIGAFTQLNIIPFAIESLNLSEIAGGYLFLSTAFGIALGSYLGGKASKTRVEIGLSCLSCILIGLCLLALSLFSHDLVVVIVLLVLLGICGGLFIVPFDSFVQISSPSEKRGQVIAANNFLSFAGVLAASLILFIYSQFLDLSAAHGFAFTGGLTLIFSFVLILRLSDYSLPFMTKIFLKPFVRLETINLDLLEKHPNTILVLRKASWKKALLLLSVAHKTHLLLPINEKKKISFIDKLFYSIHLIPSGKNLSAVLEKAKKLSAADETPCILTQMSKEREIFEQPSGISSLFHSMRLLYVDIEKIAGKRTIVFSDK